MTLPNSNIYTVLVRNALTENTTNVGGLCLSEKINMWSKWKPIRRDTLSITETDLIAENYGINPGTSTYSHTGVLDWTNGLKLLIPKKWEYKRPRGGSISEPYRLGDFRNYNHTARPPCEPLPSYTITNSIFLDYTIGAFLNMDGTSDTIGLSDFSSTLGELYLGVVLELDDGLDDNNRKWIITSENQLQNGGNSINAALPPEVRQNGNTGWFHFFLSQRKIWNDDPDSLLDFRSLGNSPTPNTFYPIPSKITDDNKRPFKVNLSVFSGEASHGINQVGTTKSNLVDIEPYRDLRDDEQYFLSPKHLYVGWEITNQEDREISISLDSGNIYMYVNPTYFGTSIRLPVSAYDENGDIITGSYLIPAGATKHVILGTDNILNRMPDGAQAEPDQHLFNYIFVQIEKQDGPANFIVQTSTWLRVKSSNN